MSDSNEKNNERVKQESARRTRRSFLVGGVAAAGAVGFYEWLNHAPSDGQLLRPLRKALNFNAAASRAVFDERALAPTYPLKEATMLRVNGDFGLERDLKLDSWRLRVVGADRPQSFP